MGSILVEYEPEPSHGDLIQTNFPDFVPNLGWGTIQFEFKVLSESGIWDHGTMVPWDHGTMGPWDHGTRDQGPGTMGPWDHGTRDQGPGTRDWDRDR